MSRGKYLSLEEARKKDKQGKDRLEQFAKEHPSKGDKPQFDRLFQAMAKPNTPKRSKKKPTGGATSG
ncbi:MAG: hypothetical protein R3B74_15240 [Nitrospirales bacterium]|nr:hypothetical protein [Nitrospirales bacterium]